MATTTITKRFWAPNSTLNCIGSGTTQINTPIVDGYHSLLNSMKGVIVRNGILSFGYSTKFQLSDNVELGVPSSDDLTVMEDMTYNASNIINNLTVDGCVFTISEIADLTVVGNVNVLNGGAIVGTYSTTAIINGDLEVLGEMDLHN